jgi:hypothetical protein
LETAITAERKRLPLHRNLTLVSVAAQLAAGKMRGSRIAAVKALAAAGGACLHKNGVQIAWDIWQSFPSHQIWLVSLHDSVWLHEAIERSGLLPGAGGGTHFHGDKLCRVDC